MVDDVDGLAVMTTESAREAKRQARLVRKLFASQAKDAEFLMSAITQFPRIIRFLAIDDCPGAACPHCGAEGRWIHYFVCDDGTRRAAMSGCVKLFPVSPVAREEARLRKKAADYEKRCWKLNQADARALDAIDSFYAGAWTEAQAMCVVNAAKRSNAARYRGRR